MLAAKVIRTRAPSRRLPGISPMGERLGGASSLGVNPSSVISFEYQFSGAKVSSILSINNTLTAINARTCLD